MAGPVEHWCLDRLETGDLDEDLPLLHGFTLAVQHVALEPHPAVAGNTIAYLGNPEDQMTKAGKLYARLIVD
jgi:hypothetical protein